MYPVFSSFPIFLSGSLEAFCFVKKAVSFDSGENNPCPSLQEERNTVGVSSPRQWPPTYHLSPNQRAKKGQDDSGYGSRVT